MVHDIAFPALGISFQLNPVAFTVFGKDIYWYGIIIATGFLLAAIYAVSRAKKFGLVGDNLIDMLLFATIAAIIGARLYFVTFNFEQYGRDPLSILYVWEGGLAIYGGIIGGVLAAWIYSRIKGINVYKFLDVGAIGLLIGQAIGRWGNFVNAEAYGKVIEKSGDAYPFYTMLIGDMAVHPIFLYESLWNIVGLIGLHFYSKKRKFGGELFLLYMFWYGIGRSMTESVRGPDTLMFFDTGLRVSLVFALVSASFAAIVLLYKYISKKRGPFGLAAATPCGAAPLEERLLQLYEPRMTKKQRNAAKAEANETENRDANVKDDDIKVTKDGDADGGNN